MRRRWRENREGGGERMEGWWREHGEVVERE